MKQRRAIEAGGETPTAAELRLYHRLQRAAHRLQKAADRAFIEAAGVSTAQAAVLALVGDGTATTQRDVAVRIGLNESAITAIVDRLERAGVIARARHPGDGRAWRLVLTVQGQQTLQRTRAPMAAINRRIESVVSAAERATLADGLARIEAEFGEANGDDRPRSARGGACPEPRFRQAAGR